MSSTVTNVLVPPRRSSPRGARFVSALFDAALSLKAWGLARHEAHRRAADAERVRRHARLVQASEPGFAADLFAAADRHVSPN